MVRIATAIILGLLLVAAIWWMPVCSFNILLIAVMLLGAIEYSRMFFKDSIEKFATILATLLVSIAVLHYIPVGGIVAIMMACSMFLLTLVFMWRTDEMEGVAQRLSLSIFGVLYLGLAFPFWGWIRGMENGNTMVLLVMAPACLCDTFAYITGKAIGKHKFAPKVSPNKTIEGFIGALIGSLAGAFLIWYLLLQDVAWYFICGLALVVWITSPFGDLIESMLKRSAGVKDSGTIIPGHGGVLDRLDALIFTAPFAYVYLKFVAGL